MAEVNKPDGCYPYGGGCAPYGGGRRGFSTLFLVILILLLFPSFYGGYFY